MLLKNSKRLVPDKRIEASKENIPEYNIKIEKIVEQGKLETISEDFKGLEDDDWTIGVNDYAMQELEQEKK